MIRPRRSETVVEREIDGELVLYDPQTDQTFLLNPVSAAIWDLCDGGNTVEDIARCIAEHFSGSGERVLRDTIDVIDTLRSGNVIVDADESES